MKNEGAKLNLWEKVYNDQGKEYVVTDAAKHFSISYEDCPQWSYTIAASDSIINNDGYYFSFDEVRIHDKDIGTKYFKTRPSIFQRIKSLI